MMLIGASWGRVVGKIVAVIFSTANPPIDASIYSLMGAAGTILTNTQLLRCSLFDFLSTIRGSYRILPNDSVNCRYLGGAHSKYSVFTTYNFSGDGFKVDSRSFQFEHFRAFDSYSGNAVLAWLLF